MAKFKRCLSLFWTMFKIGLFTFGGGYAMIAILQREIVEKKKWIDSEEFLDLIAIAESTPGPIAINSATYIGYKFAGVLGSIFATIGVVLPSFTIIFIISLFFDAFMQIEYVRYAFRGIQAGVAFLILSAGIKMFKGLKKNALSIILFIATTGCLVAFTLFSINFSTIFYILIGGVIGVIIYLLGLANNKIKSRKKKDVEINNNENEKGDM